MRQRFEQEAHAQARVDHPNICKVHEVGEIRDQVYIAMQFVDGLPLDKAAAVMSLADKVQVLRDAARALHVAHELGIIHRDIKPSNIMVERIADEHGVVQDRPVIMDFGLARESGAETHLRHAREDGLGASKREEHVMQGLQSIDKALATNGNHATSLVTQGELLLLRGRAQRDSAARKSAGNAAVQSYERALKLDPFLTAILNPRVAESREIVGKICLR